MVTAITIRDVPDETRDELAARAALSGRSSGVVVAALVDSGPVGTWAYHLLATDDLAAPHLMPVEVANWPALRARAFGSGHDRW